MGLAEGGEGRRRAERGGETVKGWKTMKVGRLREAAGGCERLREGAQGVKGLEGAVRHGEDARNGRQPAADPPVWPAAGRLSW